MWQIEQLRLSTKNLSFAQQSSETSPNTKRSPSIRSFYSESDDSDVETDVAVCSNTRHTRNVSADTLDKLNGKRRVSADMLALPVTPMRKTSDASLNDEELKAMLQGLPATAQNCIERAHEAAQIRRQRSLKRSVTVKSPSKPAALVQRSHTIGSGKRTVVSQKQESWRIKCHYESQVFAARLPAAAIDLLCQRRPKSIGESRGLVDVLKHMFLAKTTYKNQLDAFRLTYQDEDGDWVSIVDDADLAAAIQTRWGYHETARVWLMKTN
jgi:hypothetical protein